MARTLQNRLALASFKTKHGWENLTLVEIEPKVDEQLRMQHLRPPSAGDLLSDSSSSSGFSDFQYPRGLLPSSPLKEPLFSDALEPPSGSNGARKRSFNVFQPALPTSAHSARKRYRLSPQKHGDFFNPHTSWKDEHQLAQSSPIKPRKQHFTTLAGPDISFYRTSNTIPEEPSFLGTSSDDDDLLPVHSFQMPNMSSHIPLPRTPPPRTRPAPRRAQTSRPTATKQQSNGQGREGADLLMFLATSPSPAHTSRSRFPNNQQTHSHSHSNSFTENLIKSRASFSHSQTTSQESNSVSTPMHPPQTPPSKNMALPSSMMTTPGGSNGLNIPTTPGQGWDFADFVNITPSPAQKAWKTPRIGDGFGSTARTPLLGDSKTPSMPEMRTPRAMGQGFGGAMTPRQFDGFMKPPGSSPMLGNRVESSKMGASFD